jgi:hypothetical protein
MEKAKRITPEKVIEVFKQDGQEISMEQAEKVIDFMYKMAEIAVEQVLNRNSSE